MRFASRAYKNALVLLSLPIILADFFREETGREYGVGLGAKIKLLLATRKNERRIIGASSFLEHLVMATHILRVPKNQKGSVVECGCYKGRSTASLSLVCKLCDRDLEVFDSFQGLPEPTAGDKVHRRLNFPELATYSAGAFCGALEEVQENVRRFGDLSVCKFHPGYFDQTTPHFDRPCVFVFVDADLRDSVETVVKNLWPHVADGCSFFTHEAEQVEIASLFYSGCWWKNQFHCEAPGLVGAGNGLGLMPTRGGYSSPIGYTIKNPDRASLAINIQTGVQKASPSSI
jgi:O-methyltransferase